jgi:hypothetical protein
MLVAEISRGMVTPQLREHRAAVLFLFKNKTVKTIRS